MYLSCNPLVLSGTYIPAFMHAVIKREACDSIRFTALDIEISTKTISNERFIYTGYITFYIKYNENDPYIFF